MSTSWYEQALRTLDGVGMSLWASKGSSSGLKYHFQGYLQGMTIVGKTKPAPDESQAEYVERVTPLLLAVPDTFSSCDQAEARSGVRELLRTLAHVET